MNLAITKAIEQATNSEVTFTSDEHHVHYDITKRISQIIHTVRVSIANEMHRMHGAETIVHNVLTLARFKFAMAREKINKMIAIMNRVCPNCVIVGSEIFENVVWIVVDSLVQHKDVYLLDAIEQAIIKEMGDKALDGMAFDYRD